MSRNYGEALQEDAARRYHAVKPRAGANQFVHRRGVGNRLVVHYLMHAYPVMAIQPAGV
ncbi:MAG: hypothetical protein HZB53_10065 [Chloroflexi bacterium]|nr:hypothetical protein [Chloroflexota bacterium]